MSCYACTMSTAYISVSIMCLVGVSVFCSQYLKKVTTGAPKSHIISHSQLIIL